MLLFSGEACLLTYLTQTFTLQVVGWWRARL